MTSPGSSAVIRRMKPGKLPADLLRRLLASHPATDPRVLLGPSVGEDAAVLDMGGRALVVATDPITFTADLIGWCAVQVNANDVATRGAVPRWFMATVLLPKDASETLAENIFSQIADACSELGVSLIGGHTEITLGIDRPIVVGAMLGEAAPDRLVYTSGARPGDAILLTKGIAIEGTAILAREAPQALLDAGVGMATLENAGAYLSTQGIGITREALAAVGAAPVHAMHDPTEGGLATALSEMAEARGRRRAGGPPLHPRTSRVRPHLRGHEDQPSGPPCFRRPPHRPARQFEAARCRSARRRGCQLRSHRHRYRQIGGPGPHWTPWPNAPAHLRAR